jgi:hypothetical protein
MKGSTKRLLVRLLSSAFNMGKPKFEDYRSFLERKSDNYLSKPTIQIVSILHLGDPEDC